MFGKFGNRFDQNDPRGFGKHFRGGREFWGGMEEEGRGRGRRGFGREFGGRLFDGGDLRLVILSFIAEKPSHGYEIIKGIEEQMGGAYAPSAGVVYPTLNLLEDEGFATVSTDGGKKLYTITEAGRAELETNRSRIDQLLNRIREVGKAFGPGRSPQLMRAMHNFKMALRLRMAQGDMSREQVGRIAEIIDRASREIESLD
ncbi:helix-turn-helix transcriptional regulator [Silvibacterium sp.]|uniref:helix-turn-helix transcriptional regulator n=1 Tax=Silvibacterium sp. TaxID=1964179 RepID=UPI0039E64839